MLCGSQNTARDSQISQVEKDTSKQWCLNTFRPHDNKVKMLNIAQKCFKKEKVKVKDWDFKCKDINKNGCLKFLPQRNHNLQS